MILLVRHGEATHHTEHLTGGWTDSNLTNKGQQQISALADFLIKDFSNVNKKIRLLSSDLSRAEESAKIIGKRLGLKVETLPFLREKNNGRAAGLNEKAARNLYVMPASNKELDHRNYPEGETRREFFLRTVQGMQQINDLEHHNFIIVAHKGSIQNIIFSWLGLTIDEVNENNFSFDILPASLTVLGINKWQEHAVFLLNDTSHLRSINEGFGLARFRYGLPR
ncbi:MAG TPA: histidine phosphatase family protein [Candidatus Avacidaminococcus intestinavium]|uniref:Histidine phosphatase family protein n=1 Tax=Candidatus Avacidaminococcus intestinavium TaxID=2840684 RepID=A0A9D1SK49_9FIRM|nr:histidine phosphatase family protein [Candidatus Avacidaminococcus intestinavium]